MLKRYQVLLDDWLANHLKAISEKYDISFSETIRIALCLQVIKLINLAHPSKYSADKGRGLSKLVVKRNRKKSIELEEWHKFVSYLYFETRKAIEYWTDKEKRLKKKSFGS